MKQFIQKQKESLSNLEQRLQSQDPAPKVIYGFNPKAMERKLDFLNRNIQRKSLKMDKLSRDNNLVFKTNECILKIQKL